MRRVSLQGIDMNLRLGAISASEGDRPQVTVVMPIRNAASTLRESLESLWKQTFTQFEVIAVNDGSTDGTLEILRSYAADPRLVILNRTPGGIVAALNAGIEVARGDYIARLDADDLAYPERLGQQYGEFQAHSQLVLLGTAMDVIDESGRLVADLCYASSDARLRHQLKKRNPFLHSSVMMCKKAWVRAGGYRRALELAEDYDLWLRLAELGKVANLPTRLGAYRRGRATLSVRSNVRQLYAFSVARRCAQFRARGEPDPLLAICEPIVSGLGRHTAPEALGDELAFFELVQRFHDCPEKVTELDCRVLAALARKLSRTERRVAQDTIWGRLKRNSKSRLASRLAAISRWIWLDPGRAVTQLCRVR